MHAENWWQPYLPFVAIGIVLLLRLRNVNRARRMRLGRLLVTPVMVGVLALLLLFSAPSSLASMAIFIGAAAIGSALGWHRAKLMKVAYDPASDTFTLQQSPWAIILLVGIMLARRLFLPGMPAPGASPDAVHAGAHAMWVIDGVIGFGLGTIAAQNTELWLRARALRAAAT